MIADNYIFYDISIEEKSIPSQKVSYYISDENIHIISMQSFTSLVNEKTKYPCLDMQSEAVNFSMKYLPGEGHYCD